MIRRTIGAVLAALTVFAVTACRGAGPVEAGEGGSADTEKEPEIMTVTIREINKHGNLILDTTFDDLKAAGIEIGDVITVFAVGNAYEMPVGTSYTDVDSGNMICRFDLEDNDVALAINYGSFADEVGIARKQTVDEAPGYRWETVSDEVRIALKEKGGYLDEYSARHLTRTDLREDYPDLSDEAFANFRAVSVSGVKANLLYRSSTPIDPAIGRSEYAMAAMEAAGIRSVVNLDDSAEEMLSCEAYPGSYYSRCSIVNPEMSYDFKSAEFGEKVRESVCFLIENDGPYLIHCKEGKDRTGILCALLECFAGAPADDVRRDYMLTYANYYGLTPKDPSYRIILEHNLEKTLSDLLGIEAIDGKDLKDKTARYLRSVGLTDEQLAALGNKLAEESAF